MSEMTREKAIDLLKIEIENGDNESAHANADGILCDLLNALGYSDVVDAWSEVGKWYA